MSTDRGRTLIGLARSAIARALGVGGAAAATDAPWLAEQGATFVTLTMGGQLRGCIGSLEAHRPLKDDVEANALAAAFRDPRFPPLSAEEYPQLRIEVSELSPMTPMTFGSEADALAQLRPLVDGIVFEYGRHRGTFLPQVWEQLPDPAEFMARLKYKAGLPPNFWAPEVRLYRYEVIKWKEAEPAAPAKA